MPHKDKHPWAGKTVKVKLGMFKGEVYRVEDWQDRLFGGSWMYQDGNPACLEYALRGSGIKNEEDKVPLDDECVYGHLGGLGKIMHVTKLEEPREKVSVERA